MTTNASSTLLRRIMRHRHLLIALALFILAAYMRLAYLGLAEFNTDEAGNMLYARDALSQQGLPLLGRPSGQLNTPTPPHSTYVYMLIAQWTFDPLIFTGVIAFVNAIGVALLYLLAVRMTSPVAALIGTAWYAVDFYAVLFSRKIWEPELVAPVFILGMLAGWLGFYEGRRWGQLLALPLFVLTVMIHLSAAPLLIVVPFLLWTGRENLYWRSLVIGAVVSGLLVLPFALGLYVGDVPTGGPNTLDQFYTSARPLRLLADVALGLDHHLRIAPGRTLQMLEALVSLRPLWAVGGGALLLLGVLGLWRIGR
ncbi:MAG: hypothetical protein AAF125_14360 [Chloroflexota bacterium]